MKNKAMNALIEMGANASTKGFKCVVDALVLLQDEEWRNGKIMNLYHELGKMHGITDDNVERQIRNCFSSILKKGNEELVNKYLTRQNTSNSNLLHVLYFRLTSEEQSEEIYENSIIE